MNKLIADLDLTVVQGERFVRALKKRKLTAKEVTAVAAKHRTSTYKKEFKVLDQSEDGKKTVIMIDVRAYLNRHGLSEDPNDYLLFIDGASVGNSGKHLVACLLPQRASPDAAKLPVIPLLYSTSMTERYSDISKVLKLIKYSEFNWKIVCDFKLVQVIMGLKQGYCSFPCIFCFWNSRTNSIDESLRFDWISRESFLVNPSNSQIAKPLVPVDRIVMPSLHVKLGVFQHFVKFLSQRRGSSGQVVSGNPAAISYLSKLFPHKTLAKIRDGCFNGSEIDKIVRRESEFATHLNKRKKACFVAIVKLIKNFFGNEKASNYKVLVNNLRTAFVNLDVTMSTKLHYLFAHLDKFPPNLGLASEQSGERFHKELKSLKTRYQNNLIGALADFCWSKAIKYSIN